MRSASGRGGLLACWLAVVLGAFPLASSTAHAAPVITTQPQGATSVANTAVTFTVVATGTGTLRYQWYFNYTNALTGANTTSLTYTNLLKANQGTYTVVVTNTSGAVTSAPAFLQVIEPPEVTHQPANVLVAVGGNATFRVAVIGDPPLTYQWFFNVIVPIQNATNAIFVLTNAQPSDAGTYQVEITNPGDTINSVEAVLTVKYPPVITAQPTSLVIARGSNATFSVTVTGDAPLAYQWYFNQTNTLPGATNTSLVLSNAQASSGGDYTVHMSNDVGTATSSAASLTVLVPPAVAQQPTNFTGSAGSPAAFTVSATGTAPLSYQWFFNGTNALPDATNAALAVPNVQPSDAGFYSVFITNVAGSVTSAVATLTVVAPPLITSQPADVTLFQGQSAIFTVGATGSAPLAYQWYFNATNRLTGAVNSSFTIGSAQLTNGGIYSVVVTNRAGATTSQVALLTVKAPPVIVQHPANRAAVLGGSASFTVVAQGGAPLTYQWFINLTTPIADATNTTLTLVNVQPANVGTYSVRVANLAGSATSLGATLTIKLPPVIVQQPSSLTITQGNSATFAVVVTGDGPFGYRWFFNDTNVLSVPSSATLSLLNVQPFSAGQYSVLVTNDAASALSSNATLTVRLPPTITQQPASVALPPGGTATFTVAATGEQSLRYQWYFETTNAIADATNTTLTVENVQAANDGRYSVRVSNDIGSAVSATALLRVRNLPTITQPPASMTVTQGQTAIFTVEAGGDGPFTYQWFFNATNPVPSARGATLTISNVPPTAAGAYSVRVTNQVGFTMSDAATLIVLLPPSIAQQPASVTSTQGYSASFAVSVSGDGPFGYRWFHRGTNPVANGTNPTLLLSTVQPADAGDYSVFITNLVGSITSAPATLTIRLLPQITQHPASLVVTQGQAAAFTVSASSTEPLTYQWRRNSAGLPEAAASTFALSNVQPANSGAYDVIVGNDYGAVTSAVATLTVFGIDFGDAPEPAYPTLAASNGARHIIRPGIFLGTGVDAEPDGQPSASADGDDLGASDDESGVRFLAPLHVGQIAMVEVVASTNGLLNAWIDFNAAGGWAQAGEQVFTNQALVAGTNLLSFPVPTNAAIGLTFARFRFSTSPGLSFTGLAADGEVEDYALTIARAADLEILQTANVSTITAGSNATFTIRATNRGPSAATSVIVTANLSARSTFVSLTSSLGSCTNLNGVVTCNPGTLVNGQGLSVTLVARIGNGTNLTVATVTANEFDPDLANSSATRAVVGTRTTPQFANSDIILMPFPDLGPSTPYPSPIIVSGVTGAVNKILVTLRNVNHEFPDDIDVLLVGPHGHAVILMSDCGGDQALFDNTITFDPDAINVLPDADAIPTGTYRPANNGLGVDAFPAPAPAGVFGTNMAVFRGTDPNGVWSLYVVDDSPDNGVSAIPGFIADGWTMTVVTDDPIADLAITAGGQPQSVPVGSNLVYTVTVTNRGPAASTATVQNTLPPGANFISATTSRGSCVNTSGTVACNLGNLSNSASATITFTILPTVGGPLTNTFIVSGNQLDLITTNNASAVVSTVLPIANLGLAMTASQASVLVGQPVAFLLTVTNSGPDTATGIVLTNTFSTGMTFVSATSSQGQCTNGGGGVRCNLGNLVSGGVASIQITGLPSITGGNSNFASVVAGELDSDPSNNSASQLVTVNPAADLVLAATPSLANVPIGQDFVTILTVSNRGPSSTDALLLDTLPAGASFVSATSARGTCTNAGGEVQCQFTSLAPGEAASVILSVRPAALGGLTNIATVTATIGDFNLANNTASNVAIVVPGADLALTMIDRPDPVWLGEDLLYTLAVTNQGPNAATGVTVTNLLPPGVSFISAVLGQGSCARVGNEVSCSLGTLNAGAGVSVTLLVRPAFAGSITNTARVASLVADGNPGNNAAAQSTRVIVNSGTFVNTAAINTPVLGLANPFPSTIFVSGLTASVFRVRVTLNNLFHTYPDDLDVLLVSPDGRTALLMSDCGGEFPVSNVSLTFDDAAANALPDSNQMVSGVVRPTNYGADPDPFSAPAPIGPYGTNLTGFTGIDPNGAWSLYIMDDADKDSGLVAGGWSLTFSTLDPLADLVLNQAVSANPVGVSSNLVFSYSITNRGPGAASNVRLTNSLPPFLATRTATTSQGACTFIGDSLICGLGTLPGGGVANLTVSVTSLVTGTGTNSVSVSSDALDLRPTNNVSVVAVVFEQPPIITLQPLSQTVSGGVTVQFNSVAIGAAPLQYQWQRNGADLPGANSASLSVGNVSPADLGVYRVRVNNTVGTALSDPATLAMSGPPVVSPISSVTINEDTVAGPIPFVVQDYDTAVETLTLSRDSSNPVLVPLNNIVFGGSGSNRTVRVTPATNQFGAAIISIIVTDTTGAAATNQFTLTVLSVVDPIQILTQPRSLTVITGATVNLSVNASSALPLTYQWQFNGADISGAVGSSLNLPGIQSTNAGSYRVNISNADTSVASAAAVVQVVEQAPAPTITSVTQAASNVTVSFTTIGGPTYTLQYKNSLGDAAWTPVNTTTGTGEIMSILDPAAAPANRFYRVRVN